MSSKNRTEETAFHYRVCSSVSGWSTICQDFTEETEKFNVYLEKSQKMIIEHQNLSNVEVIGDPE